VPLDNAGQLPFDRSWFLHANAFSRATPWLHGVATVWASYGVVLFGGLLLWSWWISRRTPAAVVAALWAPLATLLAVAVNQPLGNAVAERRPYAVLPHVLVLVPRSTDFSFPSDHAVMAGAVATGVLLANRRLGLVAVVAALLMCADRVYVGAHYPGDVAAGLLVGAAVTLGGWLLVRGLLVRLVAALAPTRLGVLVSSHPLARPPAMGRS
jgi:undecaprenyl-diphosphatase